MTTFAVIGAGFRAQIFWQVAAGLPGVDCVGAVARRPRELPVDCYASLDDLLADRSPDFVVTSVSKDANPGILAELVSRGIPVLTETPPADTRDELTALWAEVGSSGLVQVAEQYPSMPMHAARIAAVRDGLIGTPTQVHVSSTQLYHAVALMRTFLAPDAGPVTVRAMRTTAPLVNPLTRAGWTDDVTPVETATVLATLDFGGTSGLYDFTDNQTRNLLRSRRLLVRGSHGEISDTEVVRLIDSRSVVRTRFTRRQTGYDLDLNGYATEHIAVDADVVWRNPWPEQRWNDDELAVATLLDRMGAWVHGEGEAPYPLAEGCTDHWLALAIDESLAADAPVTVQPGPWAA